VPPNTPGPLGVVQTEVQVERTDDTEFEAVVFHPVQISKEGVFYSRIAYPLPAIVFGHAYLQPPEVYAATLEALASYGHIVIAPQSGSDLFPDHEQLAEDMSHCLTFLEEQTGREDSPWHQQIDVNRFGLLGHSMGGGAAILVAASDARVKAVATLAAAETTPSAIEAASRTRTPKLFLFGSEDRIAPPDRHALAIYEAAAPPRLAIVIEGGSHCGFLDSPALLCDDGQISRTAQLAFTWERLTAFFDLYLRDTPEARQRLVGSPADEDPSFFILSDGMPESGD